MQPLFQSNSNTSSAYPSYIMNLGMGFAYSKVLLTAVKFDLFTLIDAQSLSAEEIRQHLGLHGRGLPDFLDALVALELLQREGTGENAVYSNTRDTYQFLNQNQPGYVGGFLVMTNERLYEFWGKLEEALRTGEPQNEIKSEGKPLYESMYEDPAKLKKFISGMAGLQKLSFTKFARDFDFSAYRTVCDIGGSSGLLSIELATQHPHLRCLTFDLPNVEQVARLSIAEAGLTDRISIINGDFFKDEFPAADVIVMGNVLHNWDIAEKQLLIEKAFRALPEGGALVAIENIIDDERRSNIFGLAISLTMLVSSSGGFDFTMNDFTGWTKQAGFARTLRLPLMGANSAAIAYK